MFLEREFIIYYKIYYLSNKYTSFPQAKYNRKKEIIIIRFLAYDHFECICTSLTNLSS